MSSHDSDTRTIPEADARTRHDLRTPLNQIIGYSQMLAEEASDSQQHALRDDLQKITQAARSLSALLDDLWHTKRPGQESTAVPLAGASVRPPASVERTRAHALRGKVLIVDDNELERDRLSRHLQREGHDTAVAENGLVALELLRAGRFDLVLLDIVMPQMDGYQVLEHMKTDVNLRAIPVIVISAFDELDHVAQGIELGAEDYLPKSFEPVLLRARIGACLEKKHLRDQEAEYLRHVAHLTDAAAAVKSERFEFSMLAEVAVREDALGELARVFHRMAYEVYTREQRLRQQVQRLQIEIDQSRTASQVEEITETDYFRELERKVDQLRNG
jgi:DNA-binding response OmpR family regulator